MPHEPAGRFRIDWHGHGRRNGRDLADGEPRTRREREAGALRARVLEFWPGWEAAVVLSRRGPLLALRAAVPVMHDAQIEEAARDSVRLEARLLGRLFSPLAQVGCSFSRHPGDPHYLMIRVRPAHSEAFMRFVIDANRSWESELRSRGSE